MNLESKGFLADGLSRGVFVVTDITSQILAGPRRKKKKKKVALYLSGPDAAGSRDVKAAEKVFELLNEELSVIKLTSPEEGLKVLLLKTVELIVIDHSLLVDETTTVEFVQELKKRRKAPVVFITKNEKKLIDNYRHYLKLYEELDDYVNSPVDPGDLGRRISRILKGEGRAAKRFEIKSAVFVERLTNGVRLAGTMLDLSLVGVGLRLPAASVSRGEQLRIIIPLKPFDYFHPQFGDLLKIAARVRRVSLDSETLGCSIEHLTPLQGEALTALLERASRRLRNRIFQSRVGNE